MVKVVKNILKGNMFKGKLKTILFNDRNLKELLRDIEIVENESNLFLETPLIKNVYRNISSTAVFCSSTQRLLQFKIFALAMISPHYSILNFFKSIAKTKSFAYRIRVGGTSKLTAVYPKQKLVLKFIGNSYGNKNLPEIDSLINETISIKEISNVKGLNVPKIRLSTISSKNKIPALWIEYIEKSNTKIDNRITALKIQSMLLILYESKGVEFVHFDGLYEKLVSKESCLNVERLIDNGWNIDEAQSIIKPLDSIIKSDYVLPKSRIHGDAALGNSILDKNNKLYLIDWELSRKDFLFYDMYNLAKFGGQSVRDKYEKWLELQDSNNLNILPATMQEHLYIISRYFRLNRMYMQWKATKDVSFADEKREDIKKLVLNSVNELNSFLRLQANT